MLGLTSADAPSEVVMYGESTGAEVWREGVACHAALVAHGGGSLTRRPVDSTSDTNVAAGLTWVQTQKEIQRLKDGGDPNALGADEQRAIEAQSLADHLKVELEETTRQWESLKKELSKTQDTVSNLHDQLVEA
ncbi:hypothetical protein BHM03_00006631 [Ensete ventricosum]|nr:hypothetical protein BHM03_00006631 [Ensete ventricosum]